MRASTLLIVFAIIAVVVLGAVMVQKKKNAAQAEASAAAQAAQKMADAGPPADAVFLDPKFTPLAIVSAVSSAKPQNRDSVAAEFIGQWIPKEGWGNEIREVKKEKDGSTSLRMWFTTPATFMGGGFWVIAVLPGEADISTRDIVRVQGRIDNVQELSDGSPIPMCRIILKDCRVVFIQKVP